jgi:hypothetical protein
MMSQSHQHIPQQSGQMCARTRSGGPDLSYVAATVTMIIIRQEAPEPRNNN